MWHRVDRVVFVFLLVSQCQTFNVDIHEPIVRRTIQSDGYDDPLNRDMFGYSVALYDATTGGKRYGYIYESVVFYYAQSRMLDWNAPTLPKQ